MSHQCSCQHCGGLIEFPDELAGQAVACPLCSAETLLANATTTTAAPRPKSARKPAGPNKTVVLATVAVMAVGLGAWVVVANLPAKSKETPVATESMTEKPASSSAASPVSSSSDSMKEFKPVVAAYQGGQPTEQIRNGREVFITKCTECHRQYDPASFPGASWDNIMGSMRGKAKLRGNESEDLNRFIKSVRGS